MNEILKVIKERRSIRKYLPQQIKDEDLSLILEGATFAPSGHNAQPWHFTVIQNKELLDHLSNKTKEYMSKAETNWIIKMGTNEKYHLFHNAPTVIIVSGLKDTNKELPYSPMADCSAAIQNMLLVAQSLGIASCWVGLTTFLFEHEEDYKQLNIPEDYTPLFAIPLGYSAITKEITPLERRENIVNYIK